MTRRAHHVRPAIIALAMVSIVIVALGGCAATRQTVGGWFGAATPAPRATPVATARVYYAGVEKLPVYPGPAATGKVLGYLALHEKVMRFKLEHGYAYIESSESGVKGWVDNARLLWRLPSAPSGGAPPAAESQPEEAEPEESPPPIVAPTATATEPLPAPTQTSAPAPPQPKATPRGVAPSIFNPY